MTNKILSQGFISALFQIVNFSFSLLITFYLIKNMTINDFGTYNILVLFIAVTSMLTTLNMHELFGIKISSELQKNDEEIILNSMLVISLLLTLLFVCILSLSMIKIMIFSSFNLGDTTQSYDLILLYLIVNATVLTYMRYFMYKKNVIVYNVMRTITTSLWVFPLFFMPLSIENIILLRVVFLIFALVIAIYIVYKIYGFKVWNNIFLKIKNIDFTFLKDALKFGLGTYLATLSFFLLQTTDKFMLSYMLSNDSVAYYSFANVPYTALYTFILSTFMLISIPYINNHHHKNDIREKMYIYRTLFKNILLFLLPVYLFINLFSNTLILLFAKEQYLHVESSYILLAFSYMAFALTAVLKQEVSLQRALKSLSSIYFIALLINIVINYLLIPMYDYKGAIIATMISNFFIFLFLFYKSRLYQVILKDISFYFRLIIWLIIMTMVTFVYKKYFFDTWGVLLIIKFFVTFIFYIFLTLITLYYMHLIDRSLINILKKVRK